MNLTANILYSIFLFFGMFSFAGAALLFIQFKNQLHAYVSSWVIGSILLGAGTVLIALREVVPEFISYKLGNGFNIASYVFFYFSCSSLLGKKILLHIVAIKACLATIVFVIALVLLNEKFQPALVALCGLVFNAFTGLLAFKFYKKKQNCLALTLTFIFFLTALVWSVRCFLILFGDLGIAFKGGIVNLTSFLLLLALGLAKYLSFTGLVLSMEWDEKNWLIAKNNEITKLLKEKEILIDRLLKANRTAATGALSASIAHELNQPLGASSLNIQSLKMALEKGILDPELAKEFLVFLEADNKRAATIVQSLSSIFTKGNSYFEKIQMNDLVSDILDFVKPELKAKNIELQLNIDTELMVEVNPAEIKQVILNLVNNAIHALANLQKSNRQITFEVIKVDKLVQLSIADNGSGVTAEFKPKLFQLLSTTKQNGMGIGLWLCQLIVNRNNGSIYYDDAIDGGAMFVVELPAC